MGIRWRHINWKRVGYLSIWLLCLSVFLVAMGFIDKKKATATCTGVKIIVPGSQAFVSQDEVYGMIEDGAGTLTGHLLKELPIHQIENRLKQSPYIKQVRVFMEMNGMVNVKIEQREAVMRIINQVNHDFYIDREGIKFPTSKLYAPHITVANGYIDERFNGGQDTIRSMLLKNLFRVAQFLSTDSLWNSQVEQLYVNSDRDIEIVPRVGDQRIILGNADSLAQKFDKLMVFYKEIVPKVGWGMYKTVNLKFADQLVCEKADSILNKEKNNRPHINTL